MNKRERLADFENRVRADPSAVRESKDWGRIVAVNPMADEVKLLATLNLRPGECVKIDLYWERDEDIAFVQVQSVGYAKGRQIGIYGRMKPAGHANFVVVARETEISMRVVENALITLAALRIDRTKFSNELRRL